MVFAKWRKICLITTNNSYIELSSDIVLNARWQKASFTISFESNGGTDVEDITKEFNALVNEPVNPTKENYNFCWMVYG